MNKKILFLFILIFLFIPGILLAQGIIKQKGDIVINQNEEIRGDIKLGQGNVTVYGRVLGSIVVLKGNIILKKRSFVKGDVITYNGRIEIEEDATVLGRRIEFIRDREVPVNLPEILISGKWLLFKIVISLFIFLITFLFNAFLKSFVTEREDFLKKNFLFVLFIGIILFTIFVYNVPKEAIFIFGKVLYLLYILSLIFSVLIGFPSLINFLGENFIKIFKLTIEDNLIKNLVISLIGTSIVLILIIIPKVGNIILGIITSVSFGLIFIHSLYKIFKSQ